MSLGAVAKYFFLYLSLSQQMPQSVKKPNVYFETMTFIFNISLANIKKLKLSTVLRNVSHDRGHNLLVT